MMLHYMVYPRSNETFLVVLLHYTIWFLKFYKMTIGIFLKV